MKTVIGIDLGTQGTRVVFYDFEKRRTAAAAAAPHDMISADDGTREQRAHWWTDALAACLREMPAEVRGSAVAAAVSGQQHGFVPLDAHGNVLHNVKLWCDTSTSAECDEITRRAGGAAACVAEAGNPVLPGYTASKILWLKKHKPDLYERLATILLPHDYLNWHLTGNAVMEHGDASGTALLDVRRRRWSAPLLKALDPDRDLAACLPPLVAADAPAGTLLPERAARLGLPPGLLVAAGGGDNMMGAIGTGSVRPGRLTMSLGTSGTLYGHSDTPVVDPDGNLAAFCSSTGGWLPLLCTMNCTVGTELGRELFGASVEEMNRLAASAPAGSAGLVTLPFYNGERTPNLPHGRGCLMGFTMTNVTSANILRSAMEAAVLGMRLGLESFAKLGFQASEVRLIGGGARSALWRQICADVLGLPVSVPRNDEGAALGAALQALWCLRGTQGKAALEDIVDEHVAIDRDRSCRPEPAGARAYGEVYRQYRAYLDAVSGLFR